MEKVATQLWALRTSRNCSLSEIARRAGVSKAALSQWESGSRQPRIPELEAVLTALDADPVQRSRLLAAIDAPRALRHLRQTAMSKPPATGDLLRALRYRKGWTQEQLASALGVTRAAVGRWEQGERVPSSEQIHALCYTVDAREEELVALSMGSSAEGATVLDTKDWEEAQPELITRLDQVLGGRVDGLDELCFWTLERQIWDWSARDARALPLLARVYTGHAQFYRSHGRLTEIAPYTDRAFAVLPRTPESKPTRLWAEILQANAAVHSREIPAPRRGLYLLSSTVDTAADYPEYHAWMLSDMARYLALDGEVETGLELTQRSIVTAQKARKPIEAFLRRLDYSRLLLQMGRHTEALHSLPDIPSGGSAAHVLLVLAEAHHQMGHRDDAADYLKQVITITEQFHLIPLHMEAARLQARLEGDFATLR